MGSPATGLQLQYCTSEEKVTLPPNTQHNTTRQRPHPSLRPSGPQITRPSIHPIMYTTKPSMKNTLRVPLSPLYDDNTREGKAGQGRRLRQAV
mmetsp:Transcript_21656/g.53056  ORF Transcript_21656/g.53056 Transcript_21656/m.53056 type:complete len:93 (-) Transcript_21656:1351-1629(-)